MLQMLKVISQIRREHFPLVVFKNERIGKNQGGFFVYFSDSH